MTARASATTRSRVSARRRLAAQDSSEEKTHRVERRHGAFRRSITLPSHVTADAIEASAQDGVLLILVPKAAEVLAKRITVRAGQGRAALTPHGDEARGA